MTRRVAVAAIAVLALNAHALRGQSRVLVQGLVDGEAWSTTDSMSTRFLARDNGIVATLARAQLWGAVEAWRGFVLVAHGAWEDGPGSAYGSNVELQQVGARYTQSSRLVLDAGKFPNVIGAFAPRRFSNRNPLIGVPDAYPVQYPTGVKVSGAMRVIDYRLAMVDLPAVHEGYTPEPTRAWRPVIGAGVTPYIGLRLGGSFTVGPYLNDKLSPSQLGQRDWHDFRQRVIAADLAFSAGYFELNAEGASASYDVPKQTKTVDGAAYFVEGKYTFTPRLFVAMRLERNDYPFIAAFPFFWVANKTDFKNEEVGVGFRLTATTLLKSSYRRDRWHVTQSNAPFVGPGGHAFALQLSQSYDVMDWIERARLR